MNEYEKLLKEGFFFFEEMENEKAAEKWKEAIVIDPNRYEGYLWLAEVELHYGEGPESAKEIIETGLEDNPNNPLLLIMMCFIIEYSSADYDWPFDEEYLKILNQIMELEPTWPWPRVMYVYCLKEQGKNSLAKQQIEKIKNMLEPFVCNDNMQDYIEYTFTGRSNDEISNYLDMYLEDINQ